MHDSYVYQCNHKSALSLNIAHKVWFIYIPVDLTMWACSHMYRGRSSLKVGGPGGGGGFQPLTRGNLYSKSSQKGGGGGGGGGGPGGGRTQDLSSVASWPCETARNLPCLHWKHALLCIWRDLGEFNGRLQLTTSTMITCC